MYAYFALLGLCSLTVQVAGHMMLDYPAPFNASNNPNRITAPDPYLQYPYDCCGPNSRWIYPCRGYEKLLGTPEGRPTATWAAGSTQSFNLSGIGNHYGGSCQVGFSTDKGASFRTATSFEGNCPHREAGQGPDGQEFDFTVPSDMPTGDEIIFAWIWYNREQEFNMNCAAVEITSPSEAAPSPSTSTVPAAYSSPTSAAEPQSSGKTYETANGCTCTCESPVNISTCTCTCPAQAYAARSADNQGFRPARRGTSSAHVAFSDRPLMFVADNGNDCTTPNHTAELRYPDPGPDVVKGDGLYPLELPTGACDVTDTLSKQSYMGVDELEESGKP